MCAIERVAHDLFAHAGTVEKSNLVAQPGEENGDVSGLHRLADRSRQMICVGAGFGEHNCGFDIQCGTDLGQIVAQARLEKRPRSLFSDQ